MNTNGREQVDVVRVILEQPGWFDVGDVERSLPGIDRMIVFRTLMEFYKAGVLDKDDSEEEVTRFRVRG